MPLDFGRSIRNLALVEDVTWDLGPGLIGVTGETGAGKSIIVGALKLILGERADRTLIRNGEDACTVEAAFALRETTAIDAILSESGLEPCQDGELLIKRTVSLSGANKQFVNCSPVTLQVLKAIGEFLVDRSKAVEPTNGKRETRGPPFHAAREPWPLSPCETSCP